jgi:hypothetical protein
VEALRFCSRAVCNPNAIIEQEASTTLFYPNPTQGLLHFSETACPNTLQWISMDGRSETLQPIGRTVSVPISAKGVYILQYTYQGRLYRQRIVAD